VHTSKGSAHEPSQRGQHVAVERVSHEPIAACVIEHDAPALDLIGQRGGERQGEHAQVTAESCAVEQVIECQASLGGRLFPDSWELGERIRERVDLLR
jgi:hypothetical protein